MPAQEKNRKATTSSRIEESMAPARVVIEGVEPSVDGGRFAAKRAVGETVVVSADVFADGHDALSAVLLYRSGAGSEWSQAPMRELGNDRWQGEFTVEQNGPYAFCVEGWVDHFRSWRRDFEKKHAAGQDGPLDVLAGAELVQAAAERAAGVDAADAKTLREWASALRTQTKASKHGEPERKASVLSSVLSDDMALLAEKYPDRSHAARSAELPVWVDRRKARFSTWYEMFPRSAAGRRTPRHFPGL